MQKIQIHHVLDTVRVAHLVLQHNGGFLYTKMRSQDRERDQHPYHHNAIHRQRERGTYWDGADAPSFRMLLAIFFVFVGLQHDFDRVVVHNMAFRDRRFHPAHIRIWNIHLSFNIHKAEK